MLEAVDACTDRIAGIHDFQMGSHRNATCVRYSCHFLNESQRQAESRP